MQEQKRNDVGEPQARRQRPRPFHARFIRQPKRAICTEEQRNMHVAGEEKKTAERCVAGCTNACVRLRDPHTMDGVVLVR